MPLSKADLIAQVGRESTVITTAMGELEIWQLSAADRLRLAKYQTSGQLEQTAALLASSLVEDGNAMLTHKDAVELLEVWTDQQALNDLIMQIMEYNGMTADEVEAAQEDFTKARNGASPTA